MAICGNDSRFAVVDASSFFSALFEGLVDDRFAGKGGLSLVDESVFSSFSRDLGVEMGLGGLERVTGITTNGSFSALCLDDVFVLGGTGESTSPSV